MLSGKKWLWLAEEVLQTNSWKGISKVEKSRCDTGDGGNKRSERLGGAIGPVVGLCQLMKDSLSSQMGRTKLSSEMY